jgi:hypothetical protein
MESPAASLVRHVGEVALEPFARQTSDLVQRARLFEEMCRPWNDHKLLFAAEPREGCPVEFNHLEIVPANDKQRGGPYPRQQRPSQIRTTASRDNRGNGVGALGRCCERGASAGAGTEIADAQMSGVRIFCHLVRDANEPLREQRHRTVDALSAGQSFLPLG